MTRPTIADLQAVLNTDADDVSPAGDVIARVRRARAEGPRHARLMVAAGTISVLVVVVLFGLLRDARSGDPDRPASPQVQYPSTWRAATYDEVSSFTAAVVFFSDQQMSSPCQTSADGSSVTCSGDAVAHLRPGGVSVYWFTNGTPSPNLFDTAPGTPTTINGAPAKVHIGADSDCSSIGGRTSVTATVQRPGAANNVFVMRACVNAARDSRQITLVLASLHTMDQH